MIQIWAVMLKRVEQIQYELYTQIINALICINRKEIEKWIPLQIVN